jgi:hypothetical protein
MAVRPVLFHQQSPDGEEVAQDPDTALGGGASLRQRRYISRPFANRAKQVQFDGGTQRRGALVGLKKFENECGRRPGCGLILGSHKCSGLRIIQQPSVHPSAARIRTRNSEFVFAL